MSLSDKPETVSDIFATLARKSLTPLEFSERALVKFSMFFVVWVTDSSFSARNLSTRATISLTLLRVLLAVPRTSLSADLLPMIFGGDSLNTLSASGLPPDMSI